VEVRAVAIATRAAGHAVLLQRRRKSDTAPLKYPKSRLKRLGRPMRSGVRMDRATPRMRSLAKGLMVHESSKNKSSEATAPAIFHVVEKLRPQLANLMGIGGFRALFSRALVLASAEMPWLRAVQVKADGTLEGFDGLQSQLDPAELLEGKVVLLAQLLGLLVAFIGQNLTSRLVSEVWPNFHSTLWISAGEEVPSEKTE
jgi:hypothetical protein